MREFNEFSITDAVIDRMKEATNPRVRQVSEALVRHLHDFIREIEPTEDEWQWGIDFLTKTDQICDDVRQMDLFDDK